MPTQINITPAQVLTQVFGATASLQNLWDAIDVTAYDYLDLELVVTALSFTTGSAVIVGIATGMQTQAEDGWVNSASTLNGSYCFGTSLGATGVYVKTVGGPGSNAPLLRFVRWMMVGSAGASGTIQFYIRGIARAV